MKHCPHRDPGQLRYGEQSGLFNGGDASGQKNFSNHLNLKAFVTIAQDLGVISGK
jgi:hypothetical protein